MTAAVAFVRCCLLGFAILALPGWGFAANAARPEADEAWLWDRTDSIYNVNRAVPVPAGTTLRLAAGVQVNFGPAGSLKAEGGTIEILGTAANPVRLVADPESPATDMVRAEGEGAIIQIRFADITAGGVQLRDGASGVVEDSVLHDFHDGIEPIVHSRNGGSLTLRRVQVRNYFEVLAQQTPVLIEDSLFENMTGDGIDFDAAPAGSIIRRTTIRHGRAVNVDGIDLGMLVSPPRGGSNRTQTNTVGVLIEHCLIYNFPEDKGVSIGEDSQNVVVRDTLIYAVNTGVAVKDSSTARILQTTIAEATTGLHLFEKVEGRDGGRATAENMVIWNTRTPLLTEDGSSLLVSYSRISGMPLLSGLGNTSDEPGFVNADARDFRLGPDSPLRNRGRQGEDLGARWPYGHEGADGQP